MLKIEKKSIRVIYTRLFEMHLLLKRLSICLKISLIRYIYMYIRIIRKGKGNFKGNNCSIGFDLFEYRLRVKK